MNKLLTIILCAALIGCANFSHTIQQTLQSPAQVQSSLTLAGAALKPYLSDRAKTALHNAGVQFSQAANVDLIGLYSLFPADTGSVTGNLALSGLKTTLSLIAAQSGSHNPTTLAYFGATGKALLANF